MLRNIFIFIAIFVVAALQTSFLPRFFSSENIPDLLLIIVIFAAMRVDFFKILIWIVLSGIILDMSYFAPLGLNVFVFVLVAFVSSFLSRKILVTHGIWKFLTIFGIIIIGTILNDWILAIFGVIISKSNLHYNVSLFLGKDIFLKLLFNLIIFSLIYWPLTKFTKYLDSYCSGMKAFK